MRLKSIKSNALCAYDEAFTIMEMMEETGNCDHCNINDCPNNNAGCRRETEDIIEDIKAEIKQRISYFANENKDIAYGLKLAEYIIDKYEVK